MIMIQVLNARLTAPFMLELDFSDRTKGGVEANTLLATLAGPTCGLSPIFPAHKFPANY